MSNKDYIISRNKVIGWGVSSLLFLTTLFAPATAFSTSNYLPNINQNSNVIKVVSSEKRLKKIEKEYTLNFDTKKDLEQVIEEAIDEDAPLVNEKDLDFLEWEVKNKLNINNNNVKNIIGNYNVELLIPENYFAYIWDIETELNIPAFKWRIWQVYNNKRILLADTPVIVGKPSMKTPVVKNRIWAITHFPEWSLPGEGYSAPGPTNPLWEWKLKYHPDKNKGLYYHGTPGQDLLKEEYRALSHGCVRNDNDFILKLVDVVFDKVLHTDSDLREKTDYKDRANWNKTIYIEYLIKATNKYDLIEVIDNEVFIYPNVYSYTQESDLIKLVSKENLLQELEEKGYNIEKFDDKKIDDLIKKGKTTKKNIEISVYELLK